MRNFLWSLTLVCLCGCYSHRPYAWSSYNLSEPGWRVWNGQAIWKPRKSIPELTGDVMVAVNTNGSAIIQYTKTIPFATARLDGHHWQIDFPAGDRVYAGNYPLPSHFAWFQLPALVGGVPPSRSWVEKGNLDQWEIDSRHGSETLSGYLTPQ
jgi:hypothetical protein